MVLLTEGMHSNLRFPLHQNQWPLVRKPHTIGRLRSPAFPLSGWQHHKKNEQRHFNTFRGFLRTVVSLRPPSSDLVVTGLR